MRDLPEGYALGPAERADIPALIAVDKAASTLFARTGLIHPDALLDHVPADVFEAEIPRGRVQVCRTRHGWPVGFALARPRSAGLYLDQISVHPDHGQQGLGRALMYDVLRQAERLRLPHVSLSTFRDLPWNGPFYASLGFRELARDSLEPWMLEIEAAQASYLDMSARCFMRRRVRRSLFRLGPLRQEPV